MRPITVLFAGLLTLLQSAVAEELDARALVEAAIDHWRGASSYSEMTMTIHRPKWERSMSMRSWTEGSKKSLVRVTAPAKDAGSGTLLLDRNMWTYAPKVNKVIKVPSSMMNQSWMGSDFSNQDINRSDQIIDDYDHSLLGTEEHEGHTVYVIESIPHEDAAVVWGKKVLKLRDDHVMLEDEFWDQDGVLVKTMVTLKVAEMGGRTVAQRQRMGKADAPEEWTEVSIDAQEFDVSHSGNLFTLSSLRNPR